MHRICIMFPIVMFMFGLTGSLTTARPVALVASDGSGGEITRFGRGAVNDIMWTDTDSLAVATTAGVWIRDTASEDYHLYHGHQSPVYDLDYSAEAQAVASAGLDGSVRLWNPATLETSQVLDHSQKVRQVRWSGDGRTLVTLSGAYTTRSDLDVWDAGSGEHLQELVESDYAGELQAVNHDGTLVATAAYQDVFLWNTEGGRQQHLLHHDSPVMAAYFVTETVRLLVYTQNGVLHVWNTQTGIRDDSDLVVPEINLTDEAAFVDQHHLLLVVGSDVYLADFMTMSTLLLSTHESPIYHVVVNQWTGTFAVGTSDNTIEVFTASGNLAFTLAGFLEPIVAVSVDGGGFVATAHRDGRIVVWDWRAQTPVFTTRDFRQVTSVALHGEHVAAGVLTQEREYKLVLVNYVQQEEVGQWHVELTSDEASGIPIVAMSDDYLIYSVRDTVTRANEHIGVIELSTQIVNQIALASDGETAIDIEFVPPGERALLLTSRDGFAPGTLYMLDLSTLMLTVQFDTNAGALAAAEHGDVLALFEAMEQRQVRLLDLTSLTTIRALTIPEIVIGPVLTLSHDSAALAIAMPGDITQIEHMDNDVFVLDTQTGEVQMRYEGHTASVVGLGFSHDSRYVISGSLDGTVRVWSFVSGNG